MSNIFYFRSRLSSCHVNVAFLNFLVLQIIEFKKCVALVVDYFTRGMSNCRFHHPDFTITCPYVSV